MDFLDRVEARQPAVAVAARDITERYVRARYGIGLSRQECRDLLARVRRFRPA
jgi:hypothetical protein